MSGNQRWKNARKRIKKRLGATGYNSLTETQLRSVVPADDDERQVIALSLQSFGGDQPDEIMTAAEQTELKAEKQANEEWRNEFLLSEIQYLNATPMASLRFKHLRDLKVGRDNFSEIRIDTLRSMISRQHVDVIESTFANPKYQVTCMRWVLRGLEIDKAIRKVSTDNEVGTNAR